MTPILFSSSSSSFATRGIGTLTDALSCVATEERNGEYELELTYPVTGQNFESLAVQNIILAKPNTYDNPQPFRIYKITKPLDGICTINARHISYDLSGVVVPYTDLETNAGAALSAMATYALGGVGNFTFSSDNATTANFQVKAPHTFRQLMGGMQGSILDQFGGEYHYDVWNVANMANRGADRGFTVRYGKNLIDINQEEECANCYTGVVAYYDKDGYQVVSSIVPTGVTLGYDRTLLVDATEDFDSPPDDLTDYINNYIDKHDLSSPKVSIKLAFQQIDEDYLERITLCDTVSVYFELLGVSAKAKVTRTTYDVLLDRYDSIEIGSVRSNLADTIVDVEKEIQERPTESTMQSAIDNATALITGARGGYLVIVRDADGTPTGLKIMDTPDESTAQKIWWWNSGGLGYSGDYGQNWKLAMTADGSIVADRINTGILQSGDNGQSFYLNLTTGELRMKAADIILGDQDLALTLNQVAANQAAIDGMNNYLRYDSATGVVTLGDSSSQIALRVENDKLAFVDAGTGTDIAWFTDNQLCVNTAVIEQALDLGGYRLDAAGGGIRFKWVG